MSAADCVLCFKISSPVASLQVDTILANCSANPSRTSTFFTLSRGKLLLFKKYLNYLLLKYLRFVQEGKGHGS